MRLLSTGDGVLSATTPKDWAQPLSQWLGPVDAMTLRAALQAAPASTTPASAPAKPVATLPVTPLAVELRQLRQSLVTHIAAQEVSPPTRLHTLSTPHSQEPIVAPAPEFAVYRLRCATLQRRMEWHIEPFRQHCRGVLGRVGARLRQLAEMDLALEKILGNRERAALAKVPVLLARRFDSLKQAAALDNTGWLDAYEQEFQAVLVAEMDFRLEPVVAMVEEFNNEVA